MRVSRLRIQATVRADILQQLHEGHLGVTKCRERARQSVWRKGMDRQLREFILCCSVCCKEQTQRAEPLIPTPLRDLPWQRVGTDLFEWKGLSYLLVVHFYPRFIEVAKLSATTVDSVISINEVYLPDMAVVSDNEPQFSASAFSSFAKDMDSHMSQVVQGFPKVMVKLSRQ